MKELYLHIGQPKTGTSALQVFLAMNREALREKGLYYPVFDGEYAIREKNNAMSGNAYGLGKLACDREKAEQLHKSYISKIQELFVQDERVLLSRESLWNVDMRLYENLKVLVGEKLGVCIKVIVYLRRQDESIESHWNQLVKSNAYTKSCMEYAEEFLEKQDYYSKLRKLADIIGKENVVARIYDSNGYNADNSIYKDFMSIFGIEDISNYVIPEFQVNPSFGKNQVEIKRVMNRNPESFLFDDEFRQMTRKNVIFAKSTENITKAPSCLSYEQKKYILDMCEDSNRKIGQEYFGVESSPFSELWEGREDNTDNSEKELYKDIISFLGELLISQAKEIEELHALVDNYELPEGIKKGSRIIIYGADKKGRRVYHSLKRKKIYNVLALVDKRWSRITAIEKDVQDPAVIFQKEFDFIIIAVADDKAAQSIKEYLESENILSEKIVRIS